MLSNDTGNLGFIRYKDGYYTVTNSNGRNMLGFVVSDEMGNDLHGVDENGNAEEDPLPEDVANHFKIKYEFILEEIV